MSNKEISIACKGSHMMRLSELEPIQGDLKDLTTENYRKLKGQIITQGFAAPFFVWKGSILDGTQRHRTLLKMQEEGIGLPELFPCVDIRADSLEAARRLILSFTADYGTITEQGLYEFMNDADLNFDELSQNYTFDPIDLDRFEKGFFLDEDYSDKNKEVDVEKLGDDLNHECPSCGFQYKK